MEAAPDLANSVAWPARYRKWTLVGCVLGLLLAAGLLWSGARWYFPLVLFGFVQAAACALIWLHMARHPMLRIEAGELVCRLEGTSSGKGNLTKLWRFPVERIAGIERTIHPWPGGERHYYRIHLADGSSRGLIPRPADPGARQAIKEFFDRHWPGKVEEKKI